MKIQLKQIKIRDLTNQYKDLKNHGVRGMVVYKEKHPPKMVFAGCLSWAKT